jgi:hypothetical protein
MILLYENIFDCPEEIEAAKKVGFKILDFNINTCWVGDLPSEPFIFRGSLEGLEWLDRMNHPYYCKLSNLKQYSVSNYFCYFDDRLLNNNFILLPAGKLKESKDFLFNAFGGEKLFVKPNNGDKLFTGTYVSKKWYEKDIEVIFFDLARKDVMLDDLLVISSYKEVGEETRYVVSDGKIVSDLDYPEWATDLLFDANILDTFYTVDISGDKIVEINSMSCSGLNDSFEKVYRELYAYHSEE